MAATTPKKTSGITVNIKPWCLDALLVAPSPAEVIATARFLHEHNDVARLPGVDRLAAFSLLVRFPTTKERYFSDLDIRLLADRNPAVIEQVLATAGKSADALIASLKPKPPAKKAR